MRLFTVTKPGGTKDYEFEAYTKLLEDVGIDLSNVPRTAEPGTNRRWLYTWKKKEEADSFAGELKRRTRDNSWYVHPFEAEGEQRGPVAPIDIYTTQDPQGFTYALSPTSRERIIVAFPHTKLYPSLFLSTGTQQDIVRQHGDNWWDQVCKLLTGLTEEQVHSLGGYRIFQPSGAVWHEELPDIRAR